MRGKRKGENAIVCTIVIILLLLAVVVIFHILNHNKLGNITQKYSEKTTTTSEIVFAGEKNSIIKFCFSSNIKNGNLDVILYDSKGNKVYELDSAKELVTYYTLEKTDEYTLKAECTGFQGNYSVMVL